ncbi:hypothetical protein E3N88_43575 [Mikania micrantha]|uniref:Uncharacterized protein n=1 Tax=Mikania micrantha TaxID=192012 RepID=A0A5N6LEJ2_9ASTR|nr:hypothetical protein E3N88_43575 [Mikania micrantha]
MGLNLNENKLVASECPSPQPEWVPIAALPPQSPPHNHTACPHHRRIEGGGGDAVDAMVMTTGLGRRRGGDAMLMTICDGDDDWSAEEKGRRCGGSVENEGKMRRKGLDSVKG